MSKMKILAPTRSLEMTQMQISAGADEVYLGLNNDKYSTFSYNGRFKVMNSVPVQVNTPEDLDDIVQTCKESGVKVNYTANAHYIAPGMEDEYLDYVKKGVDAGVDYLIVSNMGLINLIRRNGINTPIVAGAFLVIPNVEHVKMLKELGVKRIVLPHAVTIKELEEFGKIDEMETEVFCFMGGGNNCGRCMLLHSPVIDDIGPGCRAGYKVETKGETKNCNYFLDAAADCALCSIPNLINAGVDIVKLVGRESPNPTVNSKIVYLFKQFIEGTYAGKSVAEIRKELSKNEMMWEMMWVPRFCEKNRCKFKPTKMTNSYI